LTQEPVSFQTTQAPQQTLSPHFAAAQSKGKASIHKDRDGEEPPSFYQEFVECSSYYDLPDKKEASEISDNEEFNEARKLDVYHEDATEVFMIEQDKEWQKANGMYAF
jgi:hypothetical protein